MEENAMNEINCSKPASTFLVSKFRYLMNMK